MSRINYFKLRYVDVLVCWKILYQIHKFGEKAKKEILKSLDLDYSLGGSLPVESGLHLAIDQGLLQLQLNNLVLTEKGRSLISTKDKYEPTHRNLRKLIHGILWQNKFPWIFFFTTDNQKFRLAVPDNWVLILDNAELLNVETGDVQKWWKSLLLKYNAEKEEKLKEIGEIAEKLTLRFESFRLDQKGHEHKPWIKWISEVDDSAGYDILSANGNIFEGEFYDELLIEVKGTQRKNFKKFKFLLTRNEWNTALNNETNYFFYFWTGINTETNFGKGPYLLQASKLIDIVPVDLTTQGKWEICSITIDLEDFCTFLNF